MAGSTVLGRIRLWPICVALTAVGLVRDRQELETPEICVQGDATVVIAGKFLFYLDEPLPASVQPGERNRSSNAFGRRGPEKPVRNIVDAADHARLLRPLMNSFLAWTIAMVSKLVSYL